VTLPVYVPRIDPAQIKAPSRDIYDRMGEASIVAMMEAFYRELERSSLRPLFPADMVAASRRSAAFFVGLLGGPPLYHQRYGNPMMRARHMPFAITMRAREEWLECFDRVLADAPARYGFPDEHLPGFRAFLRDFSLWMVNTEAGADGGPGRGSASRRRDDVTARAGPSRRSKG
jgi:hemoglobin